MKILALIFAATIVSIILYEALKEAYHNGRMSAYGEMLVDISGIDTKHEDPAFQRGFDGGKWFIVSRIQKRETAEFKRRTR